MLRFSKSFFPRKLRCSAFRGMLYILSIFSRTRDISSQSQVYDLLTHGVVLFASREILLSIKRESRWRRPIDRRLCTVNALLIISKSRKLKNLSMSLVDTGRISWCRWNAHAQCLIWHEKRDLLFYGKFNFIKIGKTMPHRWMAIV